MVTLYVSIAVQLNTVPDVVNTCTRHIARALEYPTPDVADDHVQLRYKADLRDHWYSSRQSLQRTKIDIRVF